MTEQIMIILTYKFWHKRVLVYVCTFELGYENMIKLQPTSTKIDVQRSSSHNQLYPTTRLGQGHQHSRN